MKSGSNNALITLNFQMEYETEQHVKGGSLKKGS